MAMIRKKVSILLYKNKISSIRGIRGLRVVLILIGMVLFSRSVDAKGNVCNVLVLCSKNTHADESACKVFIPSDQPSDEVQGHADWIISSKDNQNMPFVILDKKRAKIFVFQKDGRNIGSAPVLLGIAIGDHYVPGTGQKKLSEIPLSDRTTPAGRFVARLGKNLHGKEVLWVNFDMALAIHPVDTHNQQEHRLERLQSQNPKDRRISLGCINVLPKFYSTIISPLFTRRRGIVYVLPELA